MSNVNVAEISHNGVMTRSRPRVGRSLRLKSLNIWPTMNRRVLEDKVARFCVSRDCITKLAGPVKGKRYDRYIMLNIFSRYIVGAHVHATESGVLAVEMMQETFGIHDIPQVVHADRGTSMTSKTVSALLSDLEVLQSHSRPQVSNGNPYSESFFKFMKYAPVFPERFASLPDARAFISEFVDWYNHYHQRSGI